MESSIFYFPEEGRRGRVLQSGDAEDKIQVRRGGDVWSKK